MILTLEIPFKYKCSCLHWHLSIRRPWHPFFFFDKITFLKHADDTIVKENITESNLAPSYCICFNFSLWVNGEKKGNVFNVSWIGIFLSALQ